MACRFVFLSLAALTASLCAGQQAPTPENGVTDVARAIVASGYRHDVPALQEALAKLDGASGEAFLIDYWRGFAHMRLAEIASLGAGTEVEPHIIAAVAALESSVAQRDDFSDGYALLAFVNDWQMMFHYDNKRYYADRTDRFLGMALELAPSNPRGALFKGLDLFHTPEMYGGSRSGALQKFRAALELFAAEADDDSAGVDPAWGAVDAHVALGNVQMELGEAEAAEHAFTAAGKLIPGCAQAKSGLAELARRKRLLAGPELAIEPIPAPIESAGAGWPSWRGPSRTGAVADENWSSAGSELWRRSVGLGYSGVTIADGRLFTKGYDVVNAVDVVRALDTKTGAEIWRKEHPAAIWNEMHEGGTLSTPVVDGQRVYVLNREGHLHCFAAADGKLLWQRELVDEEALQIPRWGFAASPLVLGNQVILNVGRVLSLDKHTGQRLWRTRHYGDAYATPTPFLAEGQARLAVFVAEGLVIIDPSTGLHLDLYEWKTQYDQNCASPLLVADGIFVSSGMDRGCALLSFDGEGLQLLWSGKIMRNTMTTSVTDGRRIYGFDDQVLRCITPAGEAQWVQRGVGSGALTLAGNRLIVLTEDGELLVVEATPDRYIELAHEKIFADGKGWTDPVLVGGLLYLRNSKGELVCRDHRVQ